MSEELRRRERVIKIFPNEQSIYRLMGASAVWAWQNQLQAVRVVFILFTLRCFDGGFFCIKSDLNSIEPFIGA